jgi:hypothetical protein
LLLNFLQLGLTARLLLDYEIDFLLWKVHFVLKLWPDAAFMLWIRDDEWRSVDDGDDSDSDDGGNRISVYDFSVAYLPGYPIVSRLMLIVNPDDKPASLREVNYSARRGAMYLFFAKNLDLDEAEQEHSRSGDVSALDIVRMLRSHGNKDLMRKVVMML